MKAPKVNAARPGSCSQCGLPIYVGDWIVILPATNKLPQMAEHFQCWKDRQPMKRVHRKMTEFTRIIEIDPAFDKRDPNPNKNYGIHGVEMRFVLKGPLGATYFNLYTNWQLPHVAKETDVRITKKAANRADISIDLECFYHPRPTSRGYHSPVPRYDGQNQAQESCEYLGGKPCYCDSSSLNAQVVFQALLTEGSEGVWRELEYYYHSVFETPMDERTVEGAELGVILNRLLSS